MIVSVASGKGGTGKTTIAVSLALALEDSQPIQFLDCDVEEPNAHFFLKPVQTHTQTVFRLIPEVKEEECTYCGLCAQACQFNALAVLKEDVLLFPELCHSCGGCRLVCPENAIREVEQKIGILEFGHHDSLSIIQGKLDIGQIQSPPLIKAVKQHRDESRTVIIDAPPGTSCPVIESVKGSDFTLLVTESTPFGFSDLQLAVDMLAQMSIPHGVIINRAGIGDVPIQRYCRERQIPLLMTIPLDREIAEAYSEGKALAEAKPEYKEKFQALFARINESLQNRQDTGQRGILKNAQGKAKK
jgi:MinD superfamily P-loop ATPase